MCLVTGDRVRTGLRELILEEMRRERESMDRKEEGGGAGGIGWVVVCPGKAGSGSRKKR